MSVEASKTMFRISKQLEECFKQLSLFSCHFIAKSSRYRNQYLNQFKRLTGKDEKDRQRREKSKHREEKQKIRQEIKKLKQLQRKRRRSHSSNSSSKSEEGRHGRDDRKGRHDRPDAHGQRKDKQLEKYRQYQREKEKYRDREKNREKDRHRDEKEKDKDRDRDRDKGEKKMNHRTFMYNNKEREENGFKKMINTPKIVSELEKQRQNDFEQDFDYKKINKKYNLENSSLQEPDRDLQISQRSQRQKQGKKQRSSTVPIKKIGGRWSSRNIEKIGVEDAQKYKILKVDEETSDFEDENAAKKVPQIQPRQPLTPYFLFLRKNRYKISKQYPNIVHIGSFSNIWKKLSQEVKKPYIDEYNRALAIFKNKLSQYKAVNPEKQKQEEKQKERERQKQKQKQRLRQIQVQKQGQKLVQLQKQIQVQINVPIDIQKQAQNNEQNQKGREEQQNKESHKMVEQELQIQQVKETERKDQKQKDQKPQELIREQILQFVSEDSEANKRKREQILISEPRKKNQNQKEVNLDEQI